MEQNFERIISCIEDIAPLSLQESWDNSGIQIDCHGEKPIKNVLVCLEITRAVVQEAIDKQVDFIVTHHPLIFTPIRSLQQNNITDQYIIELIKNRISVYSSHTPFDSIKGGNNDELCEIIGLKNVIPLIPLDEYGNGMGRIGFFPEVQTLETVLDEIAFTCNINDLRYVGSEEQMIRKVGICTGSGAEFITLVKKSGCDLFVTGDLKYHDAQLAKEMDLCVIDAGHYGTEKIFSANMANMLREKLPDVNIIESWIDVNPFEW